jgi:hypothetical protein
MDVFESYKPIRNKLRLLSAAEALRVIWAYSQYLQIRDFQFPLGIEVSPHYLSKPFPREWISEWDLELLAKEIVLNAGSVAQKGRTLREWATLSKTVNALRKLENDLYGAFGSQDNVLVEIVRIAHRQFLWQVNRPNSSMLIRYFMVFNRPAIDTICTLRTGLSVREIYLCGAVCIGALLEHPAISVPYRSTIKEITLEMLERFFAFVSRSKVALQAIIKQRQKYDESYCYAFNCLRSYPLIRFDDGEHTVIMCPIPTLLFWRFTSGLYYDLIGEPASANEFGDGFQAYVGEVIARACHRPLQTHAEREYSVGKASKRSVDWIVVGEGAALFVECKSKRLSWEAKESLTNLEPLERDLDVLAEAVVQTYKTIFDYRDNQYPQMPFNKEIEIFPIIVTIENWRMLGPVMFKKLDSAVEIKLKRTVVPAEALEEMPYSVWAIEELESGLQIIDTVGIGDFMNGKLRDKEMREWDWRGYMTSRYRACLSG